MVWPTLGLRTANEQKRTVFISCCDFICVCFQFVLPIGVINHNDITWIRRRRESIRINYRITTGDATVLRRSLLSWHAVPTRDDCADTLATVPTLSHR